MEPIVPNKKLEPGVFIGSPDMPNSNNIDPTKIIRTMKGDMALAVKKQNETIVSIAMAEEKKKAEERAESLKIKSQTEDIKPAPKPHGRIIIVIVVLVIITALGAGYVFVLPKLGGIKFPSIHIPSFPSTSDTNVVETPLNTAEPIISLAPSLVPAQYEKIFNITNYTFEKVTLELAEEIKQGVSSGLIKNLHFEESIGSETMAIHANRFFSFLNFPAPEILTRALENPFMVGIWGEENWGATPFIILKVSGYDTGFAGMLAWEKYLPSAFDSIFGTNIDMELKSKIKFYDIVVLNRDARIIETTSGKSISYVFANENTIVIAGSRSALEALVLVASTK